MLYVIRLRLALGKEAWFGIKEELLPSPTANQDDPCTARDMCTGGTPC